jgi:phosphopantothenoylcysteine synthetase/decarboxylase
MKILVTSGGTKIPIDKVRDITNMSKGTFGSKIATELLKMGNEVLFFKAKNSKSPMSITVDVSGGGYQIDSFINWYNNTEKYLPRYKELEYSTFEQYRERLERWIKIERPDVVMLAAAVSDYGVENPHDGKIRSNDLLNIKLVQLPKIIHLIKTWHPTCKLVGFKLLVNSKEHELIDAAKRSILENGCNMIVANDLSDIKDGKHKIHLVFQPKNGLADVLQYETDPKNPNFLASMVAAHAITL